MREDDPLRPHRALLIDDNPDDRELIRRELIQAFPDLEIVEVVDEATFVEALDGDGVDVIVTDYAMGWTNGLDVFRRIRERYPFLPVVMFTDTGNEEVAVEGLKAGIEDYVLKGHLARLPPAVIGAMSSAAQRMSLLAAEHALRKSEEHFRSLAENAADLVYRYRLVEPRGFEYVSPSATDITGYTPEEHYADPDLGHKIVHPDDLALFDAVSRGEGISHGRIRWIRKDGRSIWMESRTSMMADESGRPIAVAGIARDVTDTVIAEQAVEAHARELGRVAEERLVLMRKLVHAQEEERRRVALEIHDGIGQVLTSISLFAADLPEVVPEEHRARAERVRELAQRAIADSRELVWNLRPPDLERLGLVPAIRHLVENLLERATEHIDVLDETEGRRVTPELETVVFRIVQEALSNATKYARASSISVVVAVRDGVLSAVVEDDGRGFEVEAVEASDGVGLGGMRERAAFVGGNLVVESAKDVGTVIRLEVPIP